MTLELLPIGSRAESRRLKMSNAEYRRDPAKRAFTPKIVDSVYAETHQNVTIEHLDNPTQRPNHKAMTDLTRQEVDAKLAQNKAEVDARLANFDTSVKTGFAELRAEFAGLRTEMAKMQGGFEKQSHDSTKWIIGSVFAMLSLSVAIIGVMINLNKGDKSPGPQPAPIVVYSQPAPSAPATAQPPAK